MTAQETRERIGRLMLDESFAISKKLYTHYEKCDQYVVVTVLACLCKLTNIILDLKGSAVFDSKDYGDDFIYEGLKTLSTPIENLFESEEAESNPIMMLDFVTYPMSPKFAWAFARISYTCSTLLGRIKHLCKYQPDNYDYNTLYMYFADYSTHLQNLIVSAGTSNKRPSPQPAATRTYSPPAKSKSSSGSFLKVLLIIAIIILLLVLHDKGYF